jgi:hypothetical protein
VSVDDVSSVDHETRLAPPPPLCYNPYRMTIPDRIRLVAMESFLSNALSNMVVADQIGDRTQWYRDTVFSGKLPLTAYATTPTMNLWTPTDSVLTNPNDIVEMKPNFMLDKTKLRGYRLFVEVPAVAGMSEQDPDAWVESMVASVNPTMPWFKLLTNLMMTAQDRTHILYGHNETTRTARDLLIENVEGNTPTEIQELYYMRSKQSEKLEMFVQIYPAQ